jgi:P4 family phage/plasmid primase-like protien
MPTSNYGAAGSPGRPPNDPGLVRFLAETIESQASFACDAGGLLYIYQDGVYVPEAERYVKQTVIYYLKAWNDTKHWSSHLSAETTAFLATCAPTLWERPPLDLLNVRNGLLDLQSRTLQPHTPSFLSTVQLPVFYDPAAGCPVWCNFLQKVLPPDVYEAGLVWALLAQMLVGDIDSHQAILLSGTGGNGKSGLLQAIRAFLSPAVANLNLDAISSDRFAAAHLYGKLANICDDLSSRHLADTSTFKRIVGGDIITADRKYRDPLVFRPFARLIFSANELPQASDASEGFYDRWVVIPFNATFRGQQDEIPRHILDAQLAAPEEFSGVLNRALAAMPSALGCRLPSTPSIKQAFQEFRNSTDWVLIWLERMLDEHPTGVIEKKAIHQALILEAQRQRRAVISPTALYRQIRKHWPHVIETQRRLDPARDGAPCFIGLSWKQGVPPV